ncbi:Rv3654c family TadE-like protein [Nanchangia anserum]|uniref:Flp pilus-assembly TadE/G-like family protein n=1 Tax=Nanchangia anserum TaxID=2692125 RepID=A0A8I0GCP3_9ACTO|nr:Rv3654c family TadE-like protein [Nanchangia anserum]MBD3689576.1 flp pilus-assembly TadE/G-like family protein [Nanchangia anserum]
MSASLSPGLAGERPRELSAGEGGSGTVLMVGLLAVAVALSLAIGAFAGVSVAKARAQSAADCAALAAAQVAGGLGDASPCAVAGEAAARNGARLLSCEQTGWDVRVRVERDVVVGAQAWTVHARSRAGPATAEQAP